MIKFAQEGPGDTWVVFLGITLENLERIATRLEPIVFPAAQVGLGAGSFAMGTGGMGAALREQLGAAEVRCCLELSQADADVLVGGGLVERSLASLGFSRNGTVMVLLGKTEAAIVESLRAAGLITSATKVLEPSAPAAAVRREPTTRINPQLIAGGLLFVGVGAMGIAAAKNPALGALIAVAGGGLAVWGFRYPRSR